MPRTAALAFACASALCSPAVAADITIGVIAGMSGLGASYGAGIAQGAEMAVREINAAGGISGRQVKLVVVDDTTSPARSAVVMRRLVTSGVDLIVGGWGSPQVFANMDVAEQAGIPYIVVGATHPKITDARNKWTFRVIQTDATMSEQLARILVKDLGLKRIAVINDSNDYGTGNRDIFVAALDRLGTRPAEMQSYQAPDKDFSAQLNRIRAVDPEAIAIFGTIPAAPAIMNQARELGLKARFVGTGGLANELLLSLAPSASNGTVLTTYFSEEVDADAKAWADRYRREFSDPTTPARPVLAAWEYRTVMEIVTPCLGAMGSDRISLRDCIAHWRGRVFGIPADLHFDETGQLVQPPVVVEVRDGAFRLLKMPPADATGGTK
jgi:branched-chain amino acid transport system substrate-binding protein